MGILDGGQVAKETVEGQMGSVAGFKTRGDVAVDLERSGWVCLHWESINTNGAH